jgi:hypothetical protein
MSNTKRRRSPTGGKVISGAFGRARASGSTDDGSGPAGEGMAELVLAGEDADYRVARAFSLCDDDGRNADWAAHVFVGCIRPGFVSDALRKQLNRAIDDVRAGGWLPADLVQIMRRRAKPVALPILCTALHWHAERFGVDQTPSGWVQALAELPNDANSLRDATHSDLLAVAAVLRGLPRIAAVATSAPVADPGANKHLVRVRALLAKAESTTFEEEADALIAKAQELISKHSLEGALSDSIGADAADIVARRIWIEAPWVDPKSTLVHAVANANHCRSVFTPAFGFATIVGCVRDLEAVELLVTSLLAQAQAAVQRPGVATGGPGSTNAKPYRRAFWLAFGVRVGERLRDSSEHVLAAAEGTERLLPVLAARSARAEACVAELFPHLTTARRANVTNLAGWHAGKAAADLARLCASGALDE